MLSAGCNLEFTSIFNQIKQNQSYLQPYTENYNIGWREYQVSKTHQALSADSSPEGTFVCSDLHFNLHTLF